MKPVPLSQQQTPTLISRHSHLWTKQRTSHLAHGEADVLSHLEDELRTRENDDIAKEYIASLQEAVSSAS